MVAGDAHEDGEEGMAHDQRIEDVVRPDRQLYADRLERVAVRFSLDDRDLRFGGRPPRSLLHPSLVTHHNGSEIPCARMKRKCTYMRRTIKAGSKNTWIRTHPCRVRRPPTRPP